VNQRPVLSKVEGLSASYPILKLTWVCLLLAVLLAACGGLSGGDQSIGTVSRVSDVVPLASIYVHPSCGLEYLPREAAQAKLARTVAGVRRAQEVLA